MSLLIPSFKTNESLNINASSDGSGDKGDTYYKNTTYIKEILRNNQNMSYTVLKECTSLPDTTTLAIKCPKNLVKSHRSKSDVVKKGHIPLRRGKTYQCLQASEGEGGENTSNARLVPSQSFTHPSACSNGANVANLIAQTLVTIPQIGTKPTLDSSLKTLERQASGEDSAFPFLQMSSLRSLGYFNYESIFEGASVLKFGIDREDVVSLYDSSSASSCCSCEDREENHENSIKRSISHNAPLGSSELQLLSIAKSESVADLSARVEESHDHEEKETPVNQNLTSSLSQEEISALKEEIPEYRQDLYKDCFTLFLEKWFGRRDI